MARRAPPPPIPRSVNRSLEEKVYGDLMASKRTAAMRASHCVSVARTEAVDWRGRLNEAMEQEQYNYIFVLCILLLACHCLAFNTSRLL